MTELLLVSALIVIIFWIWRSKYSQDLIVGMLRELTSLKIAMARESPTAIIVVNAVDGTIKEWSPGATLIFEWTAEEMIGEKLTKLIPPEYQEQHFAAWKRLIDAKSLPRRGPFTFPAQTKTGKGIHIHVNLKGWRDNDNVYFAGEITI